MTDAALPSPTRLGAEWYKAPIDYEEWKRAARRCWKFFKRRTRQQRREFDVKDREIGREIGASRRTVQRGLWWLEKVYGVIFRDHSDGHGRTVRILLPLAGDDQADAKKPGPKPKSRAASAARPAAPTGPTPPPVPADGPPDGPADEVLSAADVAAKLRALVAGTRAEQEAERNAARPNQGAPADYAAEAARLSAEELARLEAHEASGQLTSRERRVLDAARSRSP
jgi:hypothetical protein